MIQWMLAAILTICGASVFISCSSNDDNPTQGNGGQNQWGTEELTVTMGDMNMKLKLVEGGAYSMQYERDGQTKTVTGTLSNYYMAPVEVTNKLWAAVMGAKPEGQINDGDMYPVTMVSYYDIVGPNGFLEKLNTMVKDQLPKGMKFQLPTEVQWQYAAIGGKKSKGYTYAGSNTLSDVAWYADNANGTTHPVASKQSNELGLYDMSGNVWERCSDWYVELDELPAEQGLDYAGPPTSDRLVGRGGCFENAPTSCTVGFHGREIIGLQQAPTTTVGFRLMLGAITPAPQEGKADVWDEASRTLYVNTNPSKSAYEGRTDIVSVVFSNNVTSIGDSAFYNCHINVIDIPASVVSIGDEAFAGEDSELEKVTILAADCTFGKHPFLQSILTNIYVPAESVAAFKTTHPDYDNQIFAIPEAKQEGNEIIWSKDLCEYIEVTLSYYNKDRMVAFHNTQGGITVSFTGTDEDSGFYWKSISLVQGEKLTFTSMVGNISKITIQTDPYEYEDDDDEYEPYIPVAEGWTWDAAKHTFTWQGTPSATVEMIASGVIYLERVQIRFTIE